MAPSPGVLRLIRPAISEAEASTGRPSPVERLRLKPRLPPPEIGSDERTRPMPVERLVPGRPAVLLPMPVVRGPLSPLTRRADSPPPELVGACGPAMTSLPPCSAKAAPGGNAATLVERPAGSLDGPSVDRPALRLNLEVGSDDPRVARPLIPLPDPVPRTVVDRAADGADPPPVPPPGREVTVFANPPVERCTDVEAGPDESTVFPDARLDPTDATATLPARVPLPLNACRCLLLPAPLATGELTALPS